MKILILTHIFWPEAADFFNYALAKELVAIGHDVTVLTAYPNYPLGRIYKGYSMSWRKWEFVDGIKILRVPLYPNHSKSGIKRIINYLSFTISASTIGLMLLSKPDAVFVYSPPMTLGLIAGLIKLFCKSKVILDVVDLWPEAIAGSGMMSSNIVIKGSEWIARGAYRIADRITVPTKGFASKIEALGISKEKLFIVPPWAENRHYFPNTEKDKEFGNKFGLKGKYCIIHAGNIGPYQDIGNVLAASEYVCDLDDLYIIFVGDGIDLRKMNQRKKDLKLKNVLFTGRYPLERMAGILAWGSALLISLRFDPYMAINMPSKMAAYLAMGRPIIACSEGETRQLIEDRRLGLYCSPGKPKDLADLFRKISIASKEDLEGMGRRSRILFEERFDKNVIIKKYIAMLEAAS